MRINYICSMKTTFYKRIREGKPVQIWAFNEGRDETISDYRDIGGFLHKSEWIPFSEMEEISIDEWRELARVHDLLGAPTLAQPQSVG